MNYKMYVYAIFKFLSIFMFSGIHFEKFMKKNKVVEAKMLIMALSLALAYLLTNFVFDFLNIA